MPISRGSPPKHLIFVYFQSTTIIAGGNIAVPAEFYYYYSNVRKKRENADVLDFAHRLTAFTYQPSSFSPEARTETASSLTRDLRNLAIDTALGTNQDGCDDIS